MKNISSLSRQELLTQTDYLVSEERRITAELIRHLNEIERRGLHFEMGFGSMFDLLVQHYKYSDGASGRRIAAMRLSRDVPEVVQSIESGKLSLSTASQVQHFFQNERKIGKNYTSEQKTELTRQFEGLSRRECEKELLKLSPESVIPRERERPVTPTETEIRFVASDALKDKLDKLRGLLAHHGDLSYAQLFEKLADLGLKKYDLLAKEGVLEKKSRALPAKTAPPAELATETGQTAIPEAETTPRAQVKASKVTPSRASGATYRPYIRTQDRRAIWQRAQGMCEFRDISSGRKCASRWALEIDHVKPLGRGGSNERENLRLVCRNHNAWLAVRTYGSGHMAKYLI